MWNWLRTGKEIGPDWYRIKVRRIPVYIVGYVALAVALVGCAIAIPQIMNAGL